MITVIDDPARRVTLSVSSKSSTGDWPASRSDVIRWLRSFSALVPFVADCFLLGTSCCRITLCSVRPPWCADELNAFAASWSAAADIARRQKYGTPLVGPV